MRARRPCALAGMSISALRLANSKACSAVDAGRTPFGIMRKGYAKPGSQSNSGRATPLANRGSVTQRLPTRRLASCTASSRHFDFGTM